MLIVILIFCYVQFVKYKSTFFHLKWCNFSFQKYVGKMTYVGKYVKGFCSIYIYVRQIFYAKAKNTKKSQKDYVMLLHCAYKLDWKFAPILFVWVKKCFLFDEADGWHGHRKQNHFLENHSSRWTSVCANQHGFASGWPDEFEKKSPNTTFLSKLIHNLSCGQSGLRIYDSTVALKNTALSKNRPIAKRRPIWSPCFATQKNWIQLDNVHCWTKSHSKGEKKNNAQNRSIARPWFNSTLDK
jgi:hypothetical protein